MLAFMNFICGHTSNISSREVIKGHDIRLYNTNLNLQNCHSISAINNGTKTSSGEFAVQLMAVG